MEFTKQDMDLLQQKVLECKRDSGVTDWKQISTHFTFHSISLLKRRYYASAKQILEPAAGKREKVIQFFSMSRTKIKQKNEVVLSPGYERSEMEKRFVQSFDSSSVVGIDNNKTNANNYHEVKQDNQRVCQNALLDELLEVLAKHEDQDVSDSIILFI